MKMNKRLGRGLEALIPVASQDSDDQQPGRLDTIAVSAIRTNPQQPRADFDPKGLEELKQSIHENGVIQPITVRRSDGKFELIAGERRFRAVCELGFERIPAYIMDVDSDDRMLELALVENVQREDLNPMELAKAYQRLQKEYHLTQEVVAQKVGKDRATVANFIRLLKLPRQIQESLERDEISMGHAKAIMSLPAAGEQIQIWRKTVKSGWSVRRLEDVVRSILTSTSNPKKHSAPTTSPYLKELEDQLRAALGTKVNLRANGSRGRIEISYYSDDDLSRLVDLLT